MAAEPDRMPQGDCQDPAIITQGRDALRAGKGGMRRHLRAIGLIAGWIALGVAAGGPLVGCSREGQAAHEPPDRPLRVLNQSEVQTLDPARISWQVDIRAADLLFDGLTQYHPRTLESIPCIAERWDITDQGRVYTFHLRSNATWSNGDPVTAHDFAWSWRRVLEPETAADYVYLLYTIHNAQRYNEGRACSLEPPKKQAELKARGKFVEPISFDDVGIRALDDQTLRVELVAAIPYFLDLTSFITFKPVHRPTIEKFTVRDEDGRILDFDTDWYLRPGNLVCNGPYVLEAWVQRQYMRYLRRPDYYDVAAIPSRRIEILPISSPSTAFKMYEQGEADIMPFPPLRRVAEALIHQADSGLRNDVHVHMKFGTYFYRLNTRRKPFDDPRVRKAFSQAIDRSVLTRSLCWMGEKPADSLVPPGVRDYVSPKAAGFDVQAAQQLLAEAGYPGGRGLPVIEIMFNKEATHQVIAESVKDMWQRHLGATVELSSIERGTLRQKMQCLDYSVSRAGWYGDYNDPLTFLDMFMTAPEGGGGNNDTGFADPEYDRLITQATRESDPARRDQVLRRAEEILVVEQAPIIPLYYYADMYLFRPQVRNFWPNRMGINPLRFVEVRTDAGLPGVLGSSPASVPGATPAVFAGVLPAWLFASAGVGAPSWPTPRCGPRCTPTCAGGLYNSAVRVPCQESTVVRGRRACWPTDVGVRGAMAALSAAMPGATGSLPASASAMAPVAQTLAAAAFAGEVPR